MMTTEQESKESTSPHAHPLRDFAAAEGAAFRREAQHFAEEARELLHTLSHDERWRKVADGMRKPSIGAAIAGVAVLAAGAAWGASEAALAAIAAYAVFRMLRKDRTSQEREERVEPPQPRQ
jgi:hypothetical protein